jgi:polar amino acid transport system substrate-binding protein
VKRTIALLSVLALLALAVVPALAGGPVYDDLPDLEGAEIVFAMENFYTPYQFTDSRADEPIGYEYDVVNEICRRINCVPVYETTTFELQIQGVADGTYDATLNGLFITDEREEIGDFTAAYAAAEVSVLGRAGEDRFTGLENFAEVAEAEGLIIGIQNNSFGQELVAPDWFAVPESQIVLIDEFPALLVALANGDIDAMIVDAFAGRFINARADDYEVIGGPILDPLGQHIMFQQDSPYTEAFSAAIESMEADGYLDYLKYKWSVDFAPLTE